MKLLLLFSQQIGLLAFLGCLACSTSSSTSDATPLQQIDQVEAFSLLGTELRTIPDSEATFRKKDSLLAIARSNFDNSPSLEHAIWFGRRTAYLSHYQEAIDIFSQAMEKYPDSPELYRHRGHRYISIRKFDEAISDLQRAVTLAEGRPIEIEQDGLPNKLNIPLSSLQFNIWYHLALAQYLQADFAEAATSWEQCMKVSTNPDLLCATTDWLYMTYRRLGREAEAAQLLEGILPDMEIIENNAYHNRLLMYKGMKQPEDLLDFANPDAEERIKIVTQGYGVGNWFLYNGDQAKAFEIFKQVTQSGYWSAFGYIAAEAEVFHLQNHSIN
ncbi:MAG: tetratricopeptide repeat protein [Bacteroidota bacterium]